MKSSSAARLIEVFTILPKELFRVNKGPSVTLRAFTAKPKGKLDVLTANGMVLPKALDRNNYIGEDFDSRNPRYS